MRNVTLQIAVWRVCRTSATAPSPVTRRKMLPVMVNAISHGQYRSKGNISGGARERWRREPLGGCGGMLPQKILKSRGLEMLFPAFSKSYLWFTHIANYLLRTLSQQTNAHSEYNTCNVNYKIENRLYISVSWNQQMFHLSESSL